MKKIVCEESRLEQLPSVILFIIFSGLDLKTIHSCKCVCKAFRYLISQCIFDPSFVQSVLENSHIAFMVQTKDRLSGSTIFRVCMADISKTTLDGISRDPFRPRCSTVNTTKIDANLPILEGEWDLLGSCNGLVLLQHMLLDVENCYYVWNPLMGEIVKVASCTREPNVEFSVYGLCFNSMANCYAVLRIKQFSSHVMKKPPVAEILMLRIDTSPTWRSIGNAPCPVNGRLDDVRLNGGLHWLYWVGRGEISICCFYVEDEEFRQIAPPPPHCLNVEASFELGVLWDCLCLGENLDIYSDDDNGPNFYLWVMMCYGDEQSWCKKLSISGISIPNAYPYRVFSPPRLQPISTLKNGEILMLCWGNHLVRYDPTTMGFWGIDFDVGFRGNDDEEYVVTVYPCVPSFVTLGKGPQKDCYRERVVLCQT